MQGLKGLVEQRGGLETLSSKPFIVNKIYRYVTYILRPLKESR